ncbi:hypothetical protein SHI21_08570 [Bacteriovorax sp. PP10]|uniref:Uncharacterized protein n=1 Tax=Bacteriovorax antarcticus TaxID=3088717 RepID=A0ABU5VT80_9BACT|nr:hypothetical protein [Bacteriovorax sp. PP10]MEA9356253.1 hypothetical protein [Bacteriovorax sp. PP10]
MKGFLKFISLLSFLFIIDSTFADSVHRSQYIINFSEDGKLVYINWLDYKKNIIVDSDYAGKYKFSEDEFSLANYPQNGLYLVKDRKFLWRLEDDSSGVPLNDQEHLVGGGPWASSVKDKAFSLYRNGKLIKTFKIEDFCSDQSSFVHTTSHFFWMKEYKLDNSKKQITFFTCKKDYSIDIPTGEVRFERHYIMILLEVIYNFILFSALCSIVIFPVTSIFRIFLFFSKRGSVKLRKRISMAVVISLGLMVLAILMMILPVRQY